MEIREPSDKVGDSLGLLLVVSQKNFRDHPHKAL